VNLTPFRALALYLARTAMGRPSGLSAELNAWCRAYLDAHPEPPALDPAQHRAWLAWASAVPRSWDAAREAA
jgi:hypothetical protein